MIVVQGMTAEDYLAWESPRGTGLVDGQAVVPQPPTWRCDLGLELAAGDTLTSPLPPGFALPAADVFAVR